MNILTQSEIFTESAIKKIEEVKNAKYVCETCLKGPNGWADFPVAVFWHKDPAGIPEEGSPWFGLYTDFRGRVMITDAVSAAQHPITGIIAANHDVIYSRYRHDYRMSPDRSVWIDGGRDYVRCSANASGLVTLKIVEGDLIVDNGQDMGAHLWRGD